MKLEWAIQATVQVIVFGALALATVGYIFGGIWFLATIWG